jgi:hypothetical protein
MLRGYVRSGSEPAFDAAGVLKHRPVEFVVMCPARARCDQHVSRRTAEPVRLVHKGTSATATAPLNRRHPVKTIILALATVAALATSAQAGGYGYSYGYNSYGYNSYGYNSYSYNYYRPTYRTYYYTPSYSYGYSYGY